MLGVRCGLKNFTMRILIVVLCFDQAALFQQVQRTVNRGGVDAPIEPPGPRGDIVGGEMFVGAIDHVEDDLALIGHAPTLSSNGSLRLIDKLCHGLSPYCN